MFHHQCGLAGSSLASLYYNYLNEICSSSLSISFLVHSWKQMSWTYVPSSSFLRKLENLICMRNCSCFSKMEHFMAFEFIHLPEFVIFKNVEHSLICRIIVCWSFSLTVSFLLFSRISSQLANSQSTYTKLLQFETESQRLSQIMEQTQLSRRSKRVSTIYFYTFMKK